MIIRTEYRFEKDGVSKPVIYNPATMTYIESETGSLFANDKNVRKSNIKIEESKSAMSYENLMSVVAKTHSMGAEISPAEFGNLNARHIAKYGGLKCVAAALESVSAGIQIGQDRKWLRTSETYTTHHEILPVVAFNKVNDAIQFVRLLRMENPAMKHIGYTDLKYCKLALCDREKDFVTVTNWEKEFKEDTMINIDLGNGYRFSINCTNQRQLLAAINEFSNVPEISRIEMFIDYCRRTAPKIEK